MSVVLPFRMMKKTLLVFLAGLAWFSCLISWSVFQDPDAFYHAHMALLMWQHGPLHAFPWLDLTTVGQSFADQHLLFHAIEAPFVAWLGWANGARVTTVLLSAIFLAACYACLSWLDVKRAGVWTLILVLTPPLIMRLMLGKATPLALTLFVIGLTAAWKRKPLVVALMAFLFALSHGGWAFLLGSIVLVCVGDFIHRRVVDEESWTAAVKHSLWRECLASACGAAFGLVVHPNFPANIYFLWVQVVKIGLGTPFQHVILGSEWLPSDAVSIIDSFVIWWIALIFACVGLAFASRKPLDRGRARAATAFAWPVAACLALTMKSRRNAEYLAPALALWIPWIWSLVDIKRLSAFMSRGFSERTRKIVFGFLGVVILVALLNGPARAYIALHEKGYPDASFQAAMAPVSARAKPGDRMFHSDWDEFPMLFNIDDRLRYVAGLDPTFLYDASSTLSDAYRDLTWGVTTSTKEQAWDLIHGRLESRFVFIAKSDHMKLLELIKSDSRYKLLTETDDAATFELQP